MINAPKRRFSQFKLRTLLVAVALCALPAQYFATEWRQHNLEHETIVVLARHGYVAHAQIDAAPWWWPWRNTRFFSRVEFITLEGDRIENEDFAMLRNFNRLDRVTITSDRIPDTWAASLSQLPNLKSLSLIVANAPAINGLTDRGFECLSNVKALEVLSAGNTRMSDRALSAIACGCPHLSDLDISSNEITSAGLGCLAQLTALQNLDITNMRIDDSAVTSLTAIRSLRQCVEGGSKWRRRAAENGGAG